MSLIDEELRGSISADVGGLESLAAALRAGARRAVPCHYQCAPLWLGGKPPTREPDGDSGALSGLKFNLELALWR